MNVRRLVAATLLGLGSPAACTGSPVSDVTGPARPAPPRFEGGGSFGSGNRAAGADESDTAANPAGADSTETGRGLGFGSGH